MVDAIIGNQAFQNERCNICFSLGLDKVDVDGVKCTHQMLIVHIHTGLLAVSSPLMFGETLLLFKNATFYN